MANHDLAQSMRRSPHSFFNILNTPLAMAIQRLSTVTSVVMKMRLRVERTTCGFDTRTSPILPGSTKCVSSCTVASIGFPDTYRAVIPQVRSANVISTPPCTRPRRLWCLSCATSAYSCPPLTILWHRGPIRLMNPLVSTVVQPEALSFSVALSVIFAFSVAQNNLHVVPAKAGTHITTDACCRRGWGPSLPQHRHRWLWVPARASLGRDDGVGHFIKGRRVVVKRDDLAVRRYHKAEYRCALRGVCAAACKRTGTGAEAGRGRDRAGRGRRCGKRNGAVVDAARRGPALPSRSMGAAWRTLRPGRDAC